LPRSTNRFRVWFCSLAAMRFYLLSNLRPLFCLLSFLSLTSLHAQQPPVDAADISRDLLYHPARAIESRGGAVLFRAAEYTYTLDPATATWKVTREKNALPATRSLSSYRSERLGVEYKFKGESTDDEGILEIRAGAEPEPLLRLVLWTRAQLAAAWAEILREEMPGRSERQLVEELDPAEPEVAAVVDDGTRLWLAIQHYAGEGWLGLGTLVQFDPKENQARVLQPTVIATSAVTHMVGAGGAFWLGTMRQRESGVSPSAGLVRFTPTNGDWKSYAPGRNPLVGDIVTALHSDEKNLWVATDAGMCRVTLSGEPWTCWRIVPTVRLRAPVPVANRSGGKSGGNLPAGIYEVRWANTGFFEVLTPDWIDGWISTDDFEEYSKNGFDAAPYELGNASAGGASAMRLVEKPGGDPLTGAVVFRAGLERAPSKAGDPPAPSGWTRVRARIGWISREGLAVTPEIQAVSK